MKLIQFAQAYSVIGPPPTSGTRDALNELAIERGCKKFSGRKELKKTNKKPTKQNVEGLERMALR